MLRELRAYRVLMAFSFRAAPRQAALFLLTGALMSLSSPAAARRQAAGRRGAARNLHDGLLARAGLA